MLRHKRRKTMDAEAPSALAEPNGDTDKPADYESEEGEMQEVAGPVESSNDPSAEQLGPEVSTGYGMAVDDEPGVVMPPVSGPPMQEQVESQVNGDESSAPAPFLAEPQSGENGGTVDPTPPEADPATVPHVSEESAVPQEAVLSASVPPEIPAEAVSAPEPAVASEVLSEQAPAPASSADLEMEDVTPPVEQSSSGPTPDPVAVLTTSVAVDGLASRSEDEGPAVSTSMPEEVDSTPSAVRAEEATPMEVDEPPKQNSSPSKSAEAPAANEPPTEDKPASPNAENEGAEPAGVASSPAKKPAASDSEDSAAPEAENPKADEQPSSARESSPDASALELKPPAMPPAAPVPQQPSHQGPPLQQPPPAGGMRELRVEDALLYLDHVKMEFKDRPQIYNQFLAIMKNFKSQEVDTPGVIRRVSKLFRGYNNLILGFNTFLPDGYKISLADLERQEMEERAREAREAAEQTRLAGQLKPPPPGAALEPGVAAGQGSPWNRATYGESPGKEQVARKQKSSPQQKQPPAGRPGQAKAPPGQPGPGRPGQPPHQSAVEFDHAISYVTTIKRRFANDPSTYHSFLEILHTYQKEQRGIKEVLEQVAHLFQDHPDLLKEFTFFLPDAVQEQAKERLHRAAAESESRQARQRQQEMEQYRQSMADHGASAHHKFIDMTHSQMSVMDGRGRKRPFDGQPSALQPESFVYNSAVERQFFDAAREALTSYSRDGGQAWAEFLKCLDMYAQDILSRNEMLNFVEPLLGKRNTKLFEEFKRILSASGSPSQPISLMEDSWHSVPLSEIDFSRCRRCSPSYRALPRDYPAPPCSDRSEAEAKVLNDVWVSLPVGSEESYTFRHMRRNTYEETLFRVEDERFEIDMVIDSNSATLQRLEPIAEEIAQLSQEELSLPDLGTKPAVEGAGIGGRRFQYTFDKSTLGVIHRNSIVRIYGDVGQEMFDLLSKNPTVAIPLVVERLRQKDREWRAVRDRLNRHWKELAQHNYYKSLDNRGLTWRTTDKRATSTRTLVSEIRDRAANGGAEGAEALKQKLDKAKEEHGTFYEVTMMPALTRKLDLTFLPKPDRRLFTPHLSLLYDNNSWAQRDAYRILSYALERGSITPADKERCHRLWIEFLGPFFGLSLTWMQRPAVTYQESTAAALTTPRVASKPMVVSEDDDDSMDDDADLGNNVVTEELNQTSDLGGTSKEFTDHHPLPAGAHVSTMFGEGTIVEFRRSDHIYVVELDSFGATCYLRPAAVLCSILPVEKSAYTRELCSKDVSKLARPSDQLAIGTQSLYLFFRLHETLVRRLNIAKRLAYSVDDDQSLRTLVEQMPEADKLKGKAIGRRRYDAYLSLVYALLDGGAGGAAEGGKYEDRVRGLLGHGAYELATMDKLISHIWKNLQAVAGDETMWNLIQLYRRHLSSGCFQPEAFRQEAAYHSEGEAMYAFQYCPVQGKDTAVLHFEYLGVMEDPSDVGQVTDGDGEGGDAVMTDAPNGQGPGASSVDVEEPVSKRPKRQ